MNRLTLQTPSRLHFGLLSWGSALAREFGGVGLMVDAPGLLITAEPDSIWSAVGPLQTRILAVAERVAGILGPQGITAQPLRFTVVQSPPEHVGLGLGTQLALAVARLVRESAGLGELAAADLAQLAGRGLRSGIGLHGFTRGGLIVDGGRSRTLGSPPAPLLAHLDWPDDWSVLILIPPRLTGLHGPREIQAFGQLPPLPEATVDRLCRLVLLDLLPAVVEQDLAAFGAALTAIQDRVGQGFAPAQGGAFAHSDLADLVHNLQDEGLVGVGQSSWGPTLYGFSQALGEERASILNRVLQRTAWPVGSAFWTVASRSGATLKRI